MENKPGIMYGIALTAIAVIALASFMLGTEYGEVALMDEIQAARHWGIGQ